MIETIRFLWKLLILSTILLLTGILVIPRIEIDLSLQAYMITLLFYTVLNFLAFLVTSLGASKKDREGIVYVMGGISLKFVLYLAFILVFRGLTNNLSKGFIITFFALYLVFTFFSIGSLLKLLKNK